MEEMSVKLKFGDVADLQAKSFSYQGSITVPHFEK
jgi:hypothetical protein